jgi:hypothetical protein
MVLYTAPGEDRHGRPVSGTTRNVPDMIFEVAGWPHKNKVIREIFEKHGCGRTGGAYAEQHMKNPTQWRSTPLVRQHRRPDYVGSGWDNRGMSRNERVTAAAEESESGCSTDPSAKRRCQRSKSRAPSRRRGYDSRSPERHVDYPPQGASSSSRQQPVQEYSNWYGPGKRASSRPRR